LGFTPRSPKQLEPDRQSIARMAALHLPQRLPLSPVPARLPGATIALAALLALMLGALIGLVNGPLFARVRLSPFVTTLGMLSVARGMTYVLTQGRAQYPVGPDAAAFTRFANGALLGLPTQLVSRSSRRWSAPSSGGPRGAMSPDFRVRKKPAYWFRKPGWPCNQFEVAN
jgi:hypothetical protein